jgi:hypothetical protein
MIFLKQIHSQKCHFFHPFYFFARLFIYKKNLLQNIYFFNKLKVVVTKKHFRCFFRYRLRLTCLKFPNVHLME